MREVEYQVWRHAMAQLDEAAIQMERKWGVDRLPRLVSHDLAAAFYRQLGYVNTALDAGSPADIQHHAQRMLNAWKALDAAAAAAGAAPIDPRTIEGRLPDGRLLVVTGTREEAWAAAHANRQAVVWSIEEITRVLWNFELVNDAKKHFAGAAVTDCRPEPTKPPVDWSKGDSVPFDVLGAG